jgi:LmbE family N-acetylglucosaminyl deacetylase
MLIPIPDLSSARRLLCIQPHYDDNDIAAGGTLAALAAAGCEIHYLTVADDVLGVLDPELSDDEARARLCAEQREAGDVIGVSSQTRLEYPDAGDWDTMALRREVAKHIRRLRPDFLLTVDPWLPYEAHRDHVRVGLAVAEAAILYGLPRLATDREVDAAWREAGPSRLAGVAFCITARPNVFFDIAKGRDAKHRALEAYGSQFTPEALGALHKGLELKERSWGEKAGCEFAEALKVVSTAHLHCNPDAEEMEEPG